MTEPPPAAANGRYPAAPSVPAPYSYPYARPHNYNYPAYAYPPMVHRPPKRPRIEKGAPQVQVQEDRAVQIARQAHEDDVLYRALLVRILKEQYMGGDDGARIRKEAGGGLATNLDASAIIGDPFTWSHYPILEQVLKEHMEEYFEMSWTCAQSKQQQLFNNHLVRLVYHTATVNGYTFDPEIYSGGEVPLTLRSKTTLRSKKKTKDEEKDLTPLPADFHWKKLRDRIRCYYKIHVQNSKKRLATMLKNPSKGRNRDALMRYYELVQDEPYLNIGGTENQVSDNKTNTAAVATTVQTLGGGGTVRASGQAGMVDAAVQIVNQTPPDMKNAADQTVTQPVSTVGNPTKPTNQQPRSVMKHACVQTDEGAETGSSTGQVSNAPTDTPVD